MSDIKKVGSLEIDQDLQFQEKEWRAERIGWVVMALIVLLGLLGLFSRGPLSGSTARSSGGQVEVEYERFLRDRSPVELLLRMPEPRAQGEQISLWVDKQYLQDFEIRDISPSPEQTIEAGDRLVYIFNTQPGGQPFEVKFNLQAEATGVLDGRAGVEGGEEVQFSQFIYP